MFPITLSETVSFHDGSGVLGGGCACLEAEQDGQPTQGRSRKRTQRFHFRLAHSSLVVTQRKPTCDMPLSTLPPWRALGR